MCGQVDSKMNVNEIVIGILKEISGLDVIYETDSLQNDMALDSLAMVTLLITIEERFGIELDESDMNPLDLQSVSDVVNMVKRYVYDEK